MLKIFLGKIDPPTYRLVAPPSGKLETVTVHEQVLFVVSMWDSCTPDSA